MRFLWKQRLRTVKKRPAFFDSRLPVLYMLLCMLTMSGCQDNFLERSYTAISQHSASYWENKDADVLRAQNYADLVNALLLLISDHAPSGVIRIYDTEGVEQLAEAACHEVQHETPTGSYLLDYITYSGAQMHDYYELSLQFGYRREEETFRALVNATSTEAIPDLLRAAYERGDSQLVTRIGYFATDRTGIVQMVQTMQTELDPSGEAWELYFYPDTEDVGIVEIFLTPPQMQPADTTESTDQALQEQTVPQRR